MERRAARQHGEQRLRERRAQIAQEAARIMTEHGVSDFQQAKRKAAERLGFFDEASLPRNVEVEEALREHQRLFRGAEQPQILRRRRETAIEAMRFFAAFEPRLVGPVLEGTADEHSAVCLHLYTDDPLAVPGFLDENRIPYQEQSRRLKYDRDRVEARSVYLFSADGIPVDLTVLAQDDLRQAPLDRVDDKPMQRASLSALEALLRAG